jgi:hypothetical protein
MKNGARGKRAMKSRPSAAATRTVATKPATITYEDAKLDNAGIRARRSRAKARNRTKRIKMPLVGGKESRKTAGVMPRVHGAQIFDDAPPPFIIRSGDAQDRS